MNLDDLTLGQAKTLAALFSSQTHLPSTHPWAGKLVLVRTVNSGVHIGTLSSQAGSQVFLTEARRLWLWAGAFTLNEVATLGVAPTSRISANVDQIQILDAIEILPITERAGATLNPTEK